MNEKSPYPKWVGVLLGLVLSGSAHFLSGGWVAALKWYLGLFACYVVAGALVATPGTIPLVAGSLAGLASFALWLVMLGRSYRPVRRIGFTGWLALVVLAVVLNKGRILLIHAFLLPMKNPASSMAPTLLGIHGHGLPPGCWGQAPSRASN